MAIAGNRREEPIALSERGQGQIDTSRTYLTFDLSGQTLGVSVQYVREVLDLVEIRCLPDAPHDVAGFIDVRNESIPILDVRGRLGLPRPLEAEETRIVVFEFLLNGANRPIGVPADRVRDVVRIGAAEVESPPEVVGTVWSARYLEGLARHGGMLILLLDMEAVFDIGGTVGGVAGSSFEHGTG